MAMDMSKMKKGYEENQRGGDFWSAQPGTTLLYIHPPCRDNDEHEPTTGTNYISLTVHYGLGKGNGMGVCLSYERNPVLKHPFIKALLKKKGIKLDGACAVCDAIKSGELEGEAADEAAPVTRHLWGVTPVMHRASKTGEYQKLNPKPSVALVGQTMFNGFMDAIIETGDITDMDAATFVMVNRIGTDKMSTKYEVKVHPETLKAPKKLPSPIRAALVKAMAVEGDCDLFKIVTNMIKSPDDLQALMSGVSASVGKGKGKPDKTADWDDEEELEDEDEEDEDEEPAKPAKGKPAKPAKGKPAPVEDDEDEDDELNDGDEDEDEDEEPVKPAKGKPTKGAPAKPAKPAKGKPAPVEDDEDEDDEDEDDDEDDEDDDDEDEEPVKPAKGKPAKGAPAKPAKGKPAPVDEDEDEDEEDEDEEDDEDEDEEPVKPAKGKPAKPAKAAPAKPAKGKPAPVEDEDEDEDEDDEDEDDEDEEPVKPAKGKPAKGKPAPADDDDDDDIGLDELDKELERVQKEAKAKKKK